MTWRKIYEFLTERGFRTYSLGQHRGECLEPYLVLRDNGVTRRQSIEISEYEILLYYPMNKYRGFSEYIASVKLAMNTLFPALRLTDDEQPHYLDEEVKAYMTSLVYRGTRISKINRKVGS